VRPATTSSHSRRRTVASARSTSPWTVRRPGWRAHPAKGPPSYSSVSRATCSITGSGAAPLDQLQEDHLGRVGAARAELEDARVAHGAVAVARRDLLEELGDRELVLAQRRESLLAGLPV